MHPMSLATTGAHNAHIPSCSPFHTSEHHSADPNAAVLANGGSDGSESDWWRQGAAGAWLPP